MGHILWMESIEVLCFKCLYGPTFFERPRNGSRMHGQQTIRARARFQGAEVQGTGVQGTEVQGATVGKI